MSDELEDRIEAAIEASPRVDFLPDKVKDRAGQDRPLPIPRNQTNSQPTTVRDMLYLLDVPVGAKVLDVGSGSAWTTAILAHLVGEEGSVLGLEIDPELVEFGRANLATVDRPWASIQQAVKGRLGNPGSGPYDRILVSAAARKLPQELVQQVAPGGIMVIPVAGQLWRVTKDADGRATMDRFGQYLFVPLR